ncbi:MAG TPA: 50S ribosomal protein L33 [Clostridia bacterium]|nr:50S ribosomal protein L33 [Clostridia bacterium]
MAKGQRMMIGLVCSSCKRTNYLSQRNKINTPEKMVLKKYCRFCKKTTLHKETTKFK